jgi:hypothetical protein
VHSETLLELCRDSRFDHHVVTGLLPQWSGLSVAGDTCVDETGIDLRESLVVHAVFLKRIRKVVLDEDIALFCELVEDFNTGRVSE